MRLSSLDDAVEYWIFDASSFLARIRQGICRPGEVLASHRRAFLFFACIALSFLFTPLILFPAVICPLLIGRVSVSIQRMISGDRT